MTTVDTKVFLEADTPRQGALLYFLATVAAQFVALLRYVLLVRLLGPEQLGLAAAMTVTAAFFDMICDTGSDRFLIQDRHGGTNEVQSLVQLFDVMRGFGVAASLVIFAKPIAHFYDSPSLAWGLVLVAFDPLIIGFLHADIRRVQRHHDFRPEACCMIAAEVAGLLAAAMAAWLTHHFTAVAYGLIVRALVRVMSSHILAERPYRLKWNSAHVPRLARFATPLLLNGLMLFVVSQADRVMIAKNLGLTSLGYYSAIVLLIYYPSSVLATYLHKLFLPIIAARRDVRSERDYTTGLLGGMTLFLTIAMAVGFAIVGPLMVPILFGKRFTQPAMLIGLIGILQAARFFLNWPTTAALALGRSSAVLASNITHLLIFPGALIGLWLEGGIEGIIVGFIGAELIAVTAAMALLNRAIDHPLTHGFSRLGALFLTGCAIVGWNLALQANSWPLDIFMFAASVGLLCWLYHREAEVISEAYSWALRAVTTARPSQAPHAH